MNRYQACSRCRFWISLRKSAPKMGFAGLGSRRRRAKRGQCHRYAPRAQALSPQWPWTKADDSCGEFEARPDEHRELEAPEADSAEDPGAVSRIPNG